MTIDETIAHAREVAEEQRKDNENCKYKSKVETERPGSIEACVRLEGTDLTDEELLAVKNIEIKAASEIEKLINKKQATGKKE